MSDSLSLGQYVGLPPRFGFIYQTLGDPGQPGGIALQPTNVDQTVTYGIPMATINVTKVIPAQQTPNEIFASAIAPAGYLTLKTVNEAAVTYLGAVDFLPMFNDANGVQVPNSNVLEFDTPRAIEVTLGAAGVATDLTFFGWDEYLQPLVVELTTVPDDGIETLKIFKYLGYVHNSADTVDVLEILTSPGTFGLKYFLKDSSSIVSSTWNGTALALSTFTAGLQATPTATNTDTRGYVVLPTPANGTNVLTIHEYIQGNDMNFKDIPIYAGGPVWSTQAGVYGNIQYTQNLI